MAEMDVPPSYEDVVYETNAISNHDSVSCHLYDARMGPRVQCQYYAEDSMFNTITDDRIFDLTINSEWCYEEAPADNLTHYPTGDQQMQQPGEQRVPMNAVLYHHPYQQHQQQRQNLNATRQPVAVEFQPELGQCRSTRMNIAGRNSWSRIHVFMCTVFLTVIGIIVFFVVNWLSSAL